MPVYMISEEPFQFLYRGLRYVQNEERAYRYVIYLGNKKVGRIKRVFSKSYAETVDYRRGKLTDVYGAIIDFPDLFYKKGD